MGSEMCIRDRSVEVNLDSGNVDVAYEDSLVSKEQLIEIVEDQGYDVVA